MGTAYNPKIVTDGLVLCLDAANRKSYSGSGNTWVDITGNGNTGTLTNGPTFTSANSGGLVFDGTNDYVLVNSITTLNPNPNGASFSIVLRPDVSNTSFGSYRYAIRFASSGINAHFGSLIEADSRGVQFDWPDTNNTRNAYTSNYNLTGGVIYMLTYVWTSTNRKLYSNGSLVSEGSHTSYTGASISTGYIGASFGSGNFWKDSIYTFQLYNRALTAAEIQQNFQATRGRYGI